MKINLKRGLLRLWIVSAISWMIFFVVIWATDCGGYSETFVRCYWPTNLGASYYTGGEALGLFIGWLLGVPALGLVALCLIFLIIFLIFPPLSWIARGFLDRRA